MGELASSRIVAAAFARRRCRRSGSTRARCSSPTPSTRRPCPTWTRRARGRRELVGAALAAGEVPVLGGFIGATASGVTTTLGPRRIRLLGGDLRRLPRRRRNPDLDRRGRHADRRSARRGRARARAAAVLRRSVGAGVLRRQGAPPEHDPAGGREEHPGPHSQFAAARGGRDADHGGRPRRSAGADGARLQARGDRRSTSRRRGC